MKPRRSAPSSPSFRLVSLFAVGVGCLVTSPADAATPRGGSVFEQRAPHSFFVRGALVIADPQDEIESSAGAFVQLGMDLKTGDVMFESGRISFEQQPTPQSSRTEMDVVPFLFTARYRAQLDPGDRFRLMLGLCGGIAHVDVSDRFPGEPEWTGDKWLGAYGADASLVWRAAARVDVMLGVRWLVLSGATWDVNGSPQRIGSIETRAVYAGAGWRW
ncbi:hypothetical protein ASA1KI_31360 [Opitutales bacterium ASA1]|uniref:hypothetical protein n=1 Tax=Congregicoccus parvus TaxID=3081749 RepID=UPI002B2CDCC4|nr:hypothetical protein ASA1KI_31360 [Opitutales bacterium ASA1]